MAIMSLANISQGRSQAQRLVRAGGMRVLCYAISLALASVEASDGASGSVPAAGDGRGNRARGGGPGVEENVEEETLHYASMTLFHLASSPATTDSLIRHGAHVDLVRIAASPRIACRFQAARALARLCLDSRWHQVVLMNRAVGPLVELAMQVHFPSMQREALDAIKAIACNVEIREDVLAELRVCMRARGIALDAGKGDEAGKASVGTGIAVECGQGDAFVGGAVTGEDEEEKENTPPQDRLLSLMRKLERGGNEVGDSLAHSAQRGFLCVPGALQVRELSEALSTASGALESGDSLSPTYAESASRVGGDGKSEMVFGVSDRRSGAKEEDGGDRSNSDAILGSKGFEDGAQALFEIPGGRVYKGSSGVVQEMGVRDRGKAGEGGAQRVAVKFVQLELRADERAGLLREVVRNYTCGKGLACSGREEGGSGAASCVHPNIIGFRGAFYNPTSRRLGIVLEWVEGPSLLQLYSAARFERDGVTLGVHECALHAILYQSLQALVFLHARHLIHRDIKPGSLLVRMDGHVLLTNLGNIRHLAQTAGHAASVVGTTCYFAVCYFFMSSLESSSAPPSPGHTHESANPAPLHKDLTDT